MSRLARPVLWLALLGALALGGWQWWRAHAPAPVAAAPPDTTQAGMRALTLWFAAESGDSLVFEERESPEQADLHARVAQLVDALAAGPERGGVAVLPTGTRALHVYLDDRGMMTLDLSRAFQQGFHGGSREEDLIIGSLMRTIASNLPEVKQVLVVCNGEPIGSLGGHVPLDLPIDPHDPF